MPLRGRPPGTMYNSDEWAEGRSPADVAVEPNWRGISDAGRAVEWTVGSTGTVGCGGLSMRRAPSVLRLEYGFAS